MSAEDPPATQPDVGDLQHQIADMKAFISSTATAINDYANTDTEHCKLL